MIDPARSFDRAAEEYERARPGYPAELLDLLPLDSGAEVLDLGAGTGKLTRVLAARYRQVIAVEPLDGMRAILERVVPEAESRAGSAEAIPLQDGSVDGVFVAAAFHWFANGDAVAEIGRVLRSGGVVCLINGEGLPPSPLPEKYEAYFDALEPPSLRKRWESDPWPVLLERGPFGEVHEDAVECEEIRDREGVLTFAQTVSAVAHRSDEERAQIARDLDALLGDGPFTFAWRANLTWAVRT